MSIGCGWPPLRRPTGFVLRNRRMWLRSGSSRLKENFYAGHVISRRTSQPGLTQKKYQESSSHDRRQSWLGSRSVTEKLKDARQERGRVVREIAPARLAA